MPDSETYRDSTCGFIPCNWHVAHSLVLRALLGTPERSFWILLPSCWFLVNGRQDHRKSPNHKDALERYRVSCKTAQLEGISTRCSDITCLRPPSTACSDVCVLLPSLMRTGQQPGACEFGLQHEHAVKSPQEVNARAPFGDQERGCFFSAFLPSPGRVWRVGFCGIRSR